MNWLDIVFISIISLSIIISLFRGLIKEVFSLLIWIVSFWIAYHFVDVGALKLEPFIELPSARHLISFVGLFICSLMVGGMINFVIGKLVTKTGLAASDRFFGMFFGLLRGLIVTVAITFFINATPLSEDPWWQNSKLAPHFSSISEWVRAKMPEEFSNYFSFLETKKDNEMEKLVDKIINQKSIQEPLQNLTDENLNNDSETLEINSAEDQ
jgi:membrane protein required for colicin V production